MSNEWLIGVASEAEGQDYVHRFIDSMTGQDPCTYVTGEGLWTPPYATKTVEMDKVQAEPQTLVVLFCGAGGGPTDELRVKLLEDLYAYILLGGVFISGKKCPVRLGATAWHADQPFPPGPPVEAVVVPVTRGGVIGDLSEEFKPLVTSQDIEAAYTSLGGETSCTILEKEPVNLILFPMEKKEATAQDLLWLVSSQYICRVLVLPPAMEGKEADMDPRFVIAV